MESKKYNKGNKTEINPQFKKLIVARWGQESRKSEVQTVTYKISHGDVMHSIGNIVNYVIITTHAVRQVLDYCGDHFIKYRNIVMLYS